MSAAPPGAAGIRLIVNADDFGFFDEVSRGILALASKGRLTATGVMANGPALERWAGRLAATPGLDAGVHLNASLGTPLTDAMKRALDAPGGEFAGKGSMALSILRGRIPARVVLAEWHAQIERCVDLGLRPAFLNSHEHLHMLPALYAGVRKLAAFFGIGHVRAPAAEWGPSRSLGGLARSGVFLLLRGLVRPVDDPRDAGDSRLIGVDPSGHLDLAYCRWRFGRLSGGRNYELMCHPGYVDDVARRDPKLAAYHDWQGELDTLQSDEFAELLARYRIRLATFRDISGSRDMK